MIWHSLPQSSTMSTYHFSSKNVWNEASERLCQKLHRKIAYVLGILDTHKKKIRFKLIPSRREGTLKSFLSFVRVVAVVVVREKCVYLPYRQWNGKEKKYKIKLFQDYVGKLHLRTSVKVHHHIPMIVPRDVCGALWISFFYAYGLVKLSFEKIKAIKRKENTKIEKKRSISFRYHVIHVHLLIHTIIVVFIFIPASQQYQNYKRVFFFYSFSNIILYLRH